MDIHTTEKSFLTSVHSGTGDHDLIRAFQEARYRDVLSSSFAAAILQGDKTQESSLEAVITSNVEKAISNPDNESSEITQLCVLCMGAAALQLFAQNNWTGPLTEMQADTLVDFLDKNVLEEEMQASLSEDGEAVYGQTKDLLYLYLARLLLLQCRQLLPSLQTVEWWLLRCLQLQQAVLEDKSPTLRDSAMELIDSIAKKEPLMTDKNLQILFHLEAGQVCIAFYESRRAEVHFDTAKTLAGISVQLTGAMGKRTRYQQDAKAQLVLQVTREEGSETSQPSDSSSTALTEAPKLLLPKNQSLDDDTVLESVKLCEENQDFIVSLSPLDQVTIMGIMEAYKRKQARERLRDEEVTAYLAGVLSRVTDWCVAVSALAQRSMLEKDSRRRVERSLRQMEELVKQVTEPDPSAGTRLRHLYATRVPSFRKLQRDLAALLLSLGCVGEALRVFERLKLWEDVIQCYQRLGKLKIAEGLIREQLAVKATPTLLCFLGDVTNETQHYHQAWELSQHRSARAMRCLAYLHFNKAQYDEALECFEKSLNANSLQIPVWFTYGCAAMAAKKHSVAVKAFRRCVALDYDNFEAWNNLAASYVQMKEPRKAFGILQDALKCEYENWRLWENMLIVGTDCCQFAEVIQAYHRLLDLKDKWVDEEVLKILVRAVTEKLVDAEGKPASLLEKQLLELFGRLTSKVTSNGEIWRLYAKLASTHAEDSTTQQKVLQYLRHSHRCLMLSQGWEKDVKRCTEISQQSLELAKTYLSCAEGITNATEALPLVNSARLMLKGILAKIKQQHTDPMTGTLGTEVAAVCQELDIVLEEVTSRWEQLKQT